MKIIEKIKRKQADNSYNPGVTIAFFGDSITQGCFELYKTGKNSFMTEYRSKEGYPDKLRNLIQMLYPSVTVNMICSGRGGDTAKRASDRVESDVCAYKPDLTVVCFGLNDCCQGPQFLPEYISSLEYIFKKIKESGSEIIFMTPNLMADKVSGEIQDEETVKMFDDLIKTADNSLGTFVEEAKKLCLKENIPVADCYNTWDVLKKNEVDTLRLLANRINHPVEQMHWLFAVMLLKQIFDEEIL